MRVLVVSTEANLVEQVRCDKLNLSCLHGMSDKSRALQANLVEHHQWLQTLRWRGRWFEALTPRAIEHTIVRMTPGREEYGWCERARLADRFPGLRFDAAGTSLATSVDRARIVADSNQTVFLQSFAMDTRTVVFWDPALNQLRESAEPCFARLRDVGILHFSPEAAMMMMNGVYEDPWAWWGQSRVQDALRAFRTRIAFTSDDRVAAWAAALERLLPK